MDSIRDETKNLITNCIIIFLLQLRFLESHKKQLNRYTDTIKLEVFKSINKDGSQLFENEDILNAFSLLSNENTNITFISNLAFLAMKLYNIDTNVLPDLDLLNDKGVEKIMEEITGIPNKIAEILDLGPEMDKNALNHCTFQLLWQLTILCQTIIDDLAKQSKPNEATYSDFIYQYYGLKSNQISDASLRQIMREYIEQNQIRFNSMTTTEDVLNDIVTEAEKYTNDQLQLNMVLKHVCSEQEGLREVVNL